MTLDGQPLRAAIARRGGRARRRAGVPGNHHQSVAERRREHLRGAAAHASGARGLLYRGALEREAQGVLDSFSAGISVSTAAGGARSRAMEMHRDRARAIRRSHARCCFDESTAFLNHREVDVGAGRDAGAQAPGPGGRLRVASSGGGRSGGGPADHPEGWPQGRRLRSAGELDRDDIQSRMVGRDMSQGMFRRAPVAATRRKPVLSPASEVAAATASRQFRSRLRRGEIVGIAGLKGAGGERIAGDSSPASPRADRGIMQLAGKPYAARSRRMHGAPASPICPATAPPRG